MILRHSDLRHQARAIFLFGKRGTRTSQRWIRSQALLQRSRSLLKASRVPLTRALFTSPSRASRSDPLSRPAVFSKHLSTTPVPTSEPPPLESPSDGPPPPVNAATPPEPPPEEPEKLRRKPKAASKEPPEIPLEFPDGLALEILWRPESDPGPSSQAALPPPEIFDEALHNLHITLHPQTQHRAACASCHTAFFLSPLILFLSLQMLRPLAHF